MKAKVPYMFRIMNYLRSLPPNVAVPTSEGLGRKAV
jgi:hypothetical protein